MSFGNAAMNPWSTGYYNGYQGGGGPVQQQPTPDPYAQERAFQQQIIAQEQARRNQESAMQAHLAQQQANDSNAGTPGTRAYAEALQRAAQQSNENALGRYGLDIQRDAMKNQYELGKQKLETLKAMSAADNDMWRGFLGTMGGGMPPVPTKMPDYGPAPNRPYHPMPQQPQQPQPQFPVFSAGQKPKASPLGQSLMRQ